MTRNLENGNLCLVICCKHVQPYLLVQHIPILCTLRNTPLLPLSNELSSFQLGKIFGLRTAVIIGFTVKTFFLYKVFRFYNNFNFFPQTKKRMKQRKNLRV